MAVTNRPKELDLIDRVPEELWAEVHDIVQETVIQKKKCKKAKWTFSSCVATAEFSKFAVNIECNTFIASSFRI